MACGPNAWILKSTLLEEPSVLALLLGVFLLAVGLIALRPSPGLLARMSAFAALIGLYVLAAVAYVRYDVYIWWCEEDHVIEWLSAHFLLAGWVLGLILLARLASRRRFSTTGAILTCGYFWGFWRELEWGQPFFGDKFVYTRNFFRLRAYLDPAYFDEFRQAMNHEQYRPLYTMHWVAAIVAAGSLALLIAYLIRHRATLLRDLKEFPRTPAGIYFLLGCGIFLASQLAGKLLGYGLHRTFSLAYRRRYAISHRLLNEPFECLAAACFLLSIIALWCTHFPRARNSGVPRDTRRDLPA